MSRSLFAAALLPVVLATTPADADVQGGVKNIEELDLEQLLGTVSAASRVEESVLTAPATVTVLDPEAIRLSGATSVPDLLRRVPGVQVLELAPGDYLVSLRGTGGLTGNNVVVLLDGVPMNNRFDGNVDWNAMPVDVRQIERIEVVRGPVSTIYGPDAYTGVINVVTRAAPTEGVAGGAHIGGGIDSRGNLLGSASMSVGAAVGKLRVQLAGTGRYDALNARGEGGVTQPAAVAGGGTLGLQYDFSPEATISVQLGGSYSRRSSLDHLVLESIAQGSENAWGMIRLTLRNLASVIETLEFWERGRYQRIDDATFTGFNYGGLRSADEEGGFDLRFAFPHRLKLAIGALAGLEQVEAPFLHPEESGRLRPRYGAYLTAGLDLDRWSFSVGGRVDASELANGAHFAGRASIIYHRATWALRLTGGAAYRDPTYVEVGGRFTDPATKLILLDGTPGLTPPQIVSVELGAIAAPVNAVTIKPTVFVARMSSLMVENFEPLVRKSFENDPNARWVLGGELELQWKVRKELTIEGNVAGLYFLNTPPGVQPTLGVPDQNSAVTAWLGARSHLWSDRLGLSLGAAYISPRTYNLRAGIPPALLMFNVGHQARIEAAAELKVSRRAPLWATLRLTSHLPHESAESPLPGSSLLGTTVLLALEYR